MDMPRIPLFAVFLVIFNIACCCYGLRCYSCFGTGGSNRCEEYQTYKLAMDGTGNPDIKKNCTAPYNETCIIETFAVLGATVSHIRDCSDNRRFSFTSSLQNNRSAYDRLYELSDNNETSCVWDGNHQVCLSKCSEDFCNGPQLEEIIVTDAGHMNRISLNILLAYILFLLLH